MSDNEKQPVPATAKASSLGSILIAAVLAVVIGIAITAMGCIYVMRSGKLTVSATRNEDRPKTSSAKSYPLVLEPLLVNLSDPTGNAYLKLSITLLVDEEDTKEISKAKEELENKEKGAAARAAARDAILQAASSQTSADLLAVNGKDHLKSKISQSLAQRVPALHVSEVLFTDFLVQR